MCSGRVTARSVEFGTKTKSTARVANGEQHNRRRLGRSAGRRRSWWLGLATATTLQLEEVECLKVRALLSSTRFLLRIRKNEVSRGRLLIPLLSSLFFLLSSLFESDRRLKGSRPRRGGRLGRLRQAKANWGERRICRHSDPHGQKNRRSHSRLHPETVSGSPVRMLYPYVSFHHFKATPKRVLTHRNDSCRVLPVFVFLNIFLVVNILKRSVLGEEGGLKGNGSSPFLWCIDPLDGTTNFAHSFPSFGVSVGLLHNGAFQFQFSIWFKLLSFVLSFLFALFRVLLLTCSFGYRSSYCCKCCWIHWGSLLLGYKRVQWCVSIFKLLHSTFLIPLLLTDWHVLLLSFLPSALHLFKKFLILAAGRGLGTTCNGVKCETSKTASVENSLLVSGFGYDHDEAWALNMDFFRHFTHVSRGVRRLGAASVDLCQVALGLTEAYYEFYLKPWDVCAGILIVEESGGQVRTMDGRPYTVFDKSMICCNNDQIMTEMLGHIQPKVEALKRGRKVDVETKWFIPDGYKIR